MDSGYPLQNYQPQPRGYAPAPQNFKSEDPLSDKSQDDYGYTPISEPQKQTNNSAVVVSSQPTPTIATTAIHHDVGDHYLTLSVTVTVLCFITGSWSALLCTIPAIIFSSMARDAEAHGDMETARVHSRWSLGCSIGGLITGAIGIMIVIIMIASVVYSSQTSTPSSSCSLYYNYYYSSYTYNCYKLICYAVHYFHNKNILISELHCCLFFHTSSIFELRIFLSSYFREIDTPRTDFVYK
ncbi:PREDICTED: uncharacterized protein LOC109581060 isoform X2 [Amphimedon queenslandica]|uniref:Uncharacterized protein n=1 Tax=Amphimedon queenslandica TaxID=400682 RepID=A0AAN0J0X5_AMPQE|nr:PREDICTED: uncharacterized protein LOC109581060 isoform X2 [Amphimedon queenslandica]|eukprot:XP_019850383.1 PREDICTED: uncharacterized protein LOC109581060 isoform X2 [Amphimedon queenslandica]